MAISVKTGRFNSPNSTGNQAVTGVGFQPQLVLFMVSTADTGNGAAGIENTANFGFGAAVSASEEACVAVGVANGNNYSDTLTSSTRCIVMFLGALSPSIRIDAEFVSHDSDGFTVNWTNVHGTIQYYIDYIAIAGIEDCAVTLFQSATSTGTQGITGVGFQPDGILFFGGYGEGLGALSDADMMFGFSDGTNHRCSTFSSEDDVAAQARCMRNDACIYGIDDTQAEMLNADVDSLDSDGFTLNWTTVDASNARYLVAVSFKGVVAKVGSGACRTTTGTQGYTVDTGHETQVLFLSMTGQGTENSISTSEARVSIGFAAASDSEMGRWIGRTGTDSNNAWSNAAILQLWDEATETADMEADVDSFDANGFTLDFTTVDGSTRNFFYLSLASVPPLAASGPMVDASSMVMTAETHASASGKMTDVSAMTIVAGSVISAAGPMVDVTEMNIIATIASRLLPTSIPYFDIDLPWTVTIGGTPTDTIRCALRRTSYREYGDMHVGVYENTGDGATSGFTISVAMVGNVSSFSDDGQAFKYAMIRKLFTTYAQYQATVIANQQKPSPSIPDAPGLLWPLTQAVADYANGGGGAMPRPLGSFAAFRLIPSSEFTTVSTVIDMYRGTPL